jgi:signal transduction histidine kinase
MSPPTARPPLRRDTENGIAAGVLAGIARSTGIDPVLVRIIYVCLVFVTGGLGLLAYPIAWAAMPAIGSESTALTRRFSLPRAGADWQIALGLGLLTLSALLAFRELGIWWSDAIAWPVALAAFGAALLWRRSRREPATASRRPARPTATEAEGASARRRVADLYRGVFGALLVLGAALLFLSSNDILGLRDAALTSVVVIVALGLILAPFLWRLGRNLADERAERIRSQERAELAAHLHDSVLQTLALVQKRAGNPREVATLARRQERELRAWLTGEAERESHGLAAALGSAAASVEDSHGVPVEVVLVGDAELDDRATALVAATREALTNAAKFAPDAGAVALYAEVGDGRAQVFVRDRGEGFDPDAIPADRRGVRESILGRMERHGGRAEIRSSPERGTEVELTIPIAASAQAQPLEASA